MVSNIRLAEIHLRLAEIFCTGYNESKVFGNINMFLLGDLLQVILF